MAILALIIGVVLIVKGIRKAKKDRSSEYSVSVEMYQPSATFCAYQKEQERQRKETEKRILAEKRERAKAENLAMQKDLAAYDLEYIRHKLEQVYRLIEIAEDRQEGTIYGGKEWLKQEKEIMRLEAQAQALKKNERKAKAVMARK